MTIKRLSYSHRDHSTRIVNTLATTLTIHIDNTTHGRVTFIRFVTFTHEFRHEFQMHHPPPPMMPPPPPPPMFIHPPIHPPNIPMPHIEKVSLFFDARADQLNQLFTGAFNQNRPTQHRPPASSPSSTTADELTRAAERLLSA